MQAIATIVVLTLAGVVIAAVAGVDVVAFILLGVLGVCALIMALAFIWDA